MYLDSGDSYSAVLHLSHLNVYNNTAQGILIYSTDSAGSDPTTVTIAISSVTCINNVNPLTIYVPLRFIVHFGVTITIDNSIINNNAANDFEYTAPGLGVLRLFLVSSVISVTITNCQFYNNFNGAMGIQMAASASDCKLITTSSITLTNVTIYNTTTTNDSIYDNIATVSIVIVNTKAAYVVFTNVNFISNNYLRHGGEVLLIENNNCNFCGAADSTRGYITLTNCTFDDNTAFDHVVFMNSKTVYANIEICECKFIKNFGGENIVYIISLISNSQLVSSVTTLGNSRFSDNKGSGLHLVFTDFVFEGSVLFINGIASSGAAIYFEDVQSITSYTDDIRFINNSAVQTGGALYFNLATDNCNPFLNPFSDPSNVTFINNSANIAGNSIYFSIPKVCHVNINIDNKSSILYYPNKFNYSQPFYTKRPSSASGNFSM